MATYCGVFVSDLERDDGGGDLVSDLERDDGDKDGYSDEILSGHSSNGGTSEQESEITVIPPSPRPLVRFYGKKTALKRRLNFTSSQSDDCDDTLKKLSRDFSSFANTPPLKRVTSRGAEPPSKKTMSAEDSGVTSISSNPSGRPSTSVRSSSLSAERDYTKSTPLGRPNIAQRYSDVTTGKDRTGRAKSTPSGIQNVAQRSSGLSTGKDCTGRAKSTPSGIHSTAQQCSSVSTDKGHTSRVRSTPSIPSSAVSEESLSINTEGTPNQSMQQHLVAILSEVRRTNSRLDDFESRLKSVEQSQHTSPSSSSSSAAPKRKVPPYIRQLVREVYRTQTEESDEFMGFHLKKRYTDPDNQAVVKVLITETKAQDPTASVSCIKDAVRRFFQTKIEEAALKEKGTYDIKVQKQRRRNRIMKKLESRRAAFERLQLDEGKKEKWRVVLVPAFISSEESAEDENDESRPVLHVKSLPWRATQISKVFKLLDDRAEKCKSKRARMQTLERVTGDDSKRPKPVLEFGSKFWGFSQ